MDLRNTQLRPSQTFRDIFLPSTNTPTNRNIDLSFQSSSHPLIDLLLIRLMPKLWATNRPIPITSSKGSHDIDKVHLEVAVVIYHHRMIQHIESWLIYLTFFNLQLPMNKIYHWILQPIFQRLIVRSPLERDIASEMIFRVNPAGNGVHQTPVHMIFYLLYNGVKYTFNWACQEHVILFTAISPSFCLQ